LGKLFNPHSLQSKIFIACFVISSGVTLIAAYAITQIAVKTITNNTYAYISENIRHADSSLNAFFEDAAAISLAIASNRSMVMEGLLDKSPEASYDAFFLQKEIENFLSGMIVNKNHITVAAVIGRDGKSFQSGGSLILKRIIQEFWYQETLKNTGMRIFYNTPDPRRIFLCRPASYNRQTPGVAVIELDHATLSQVYAGTPLEQTRLIVFTGGGDIVFANYDAGAVTNVRESNLAPLLENYDPRKKSYVLDGEKVLIALYRSPFNQLTTAACIFQDDLLTEALHIRRQMFYVGAVSTAAAAMTAWFFSRTICRNIQRLQESMLKIREGHMEVRSRIRTRDEVGVMSDIFNNMMDRIEALLRNIRETEEQKRRAEQNVLEAQIQPHFIYNTINSIGYVAHMRGEKELEEVSTSVVRLLRGVLGGRESFIPLWQEHDYIEQYLVIQRFKMKRNFRVNWDVEPELWAFSIPKLILQPLVENALLHGIPRKAGGQIAIQVFRREKTLVIKVTDNGKGMTREEIEQLRNGSSGSSGSPGSPESPGRGTASSRFRKVGFSNVRERIALIYGNQFGVDITSFPGAFTCVELTLPYKEDGP
jgi:two-component system sensor histidine kinase YesM